MQIQTNGRKSRVWAFDGGQAAMTVFQNLWRGFARHWKLVRCELTFLMRCMGTIKLTAAGYGEATLVFGLYHAARSSTTAAGP